MGSPARADECDVNHGRTDSTGQNLLRGDALCLACPPAWSRWSCSPPRPLAPAVDGPKPAAAPKRTPVPLTPLQVGQRYAKQLKDGDPVDAVRRYWDIDAMLDAAFTDSMKNVSAADRAGDEAAAAAVRRARPRRMRSWPPCSARRRWKASAPPSTTPTRRPRPSTTTWSTRTSGSSTRSCCANPPTSAWRIIDAGAIGKMIVPIIRREYARQVDHMTPLEFMQDLVTRVHTP